VFSRWYAVKIQGPQMVRDQIKFGNRLSRYNRLGDCFRIVLVLWEIPVLQEYFDIVTVLMLRFRSAVEI